jgi:peptide-methionine (S)-S-oxide reductase
MMNNNNYEVGVFGGGCFWCTEAVFASLKGVISVMPGYSGGTLTNPTYEQVSGGNTGHVECTKVEFDPEIISYEQLLKVFFETHDPTTLNRQGNDVGTQYRSVIFYTSENQKSSALNFINKITESGLYKSPVVTTVEPLGEFYPAEDYHQKYYENHKDAPYCQIVIAPKLEKVEKLQG